MRSPSPRPTPSTTSGLSTPSGAVSRVTSDFLRDYKNAGGNAGGGCAVSAGTRGYHRRPRFPPWPVLIVTLRRRRVKRALAIVAGAAALLCARRAGVRTPGPADRRRARPATTPAQNFALEVRVAPYRPQVDDGRPARGTPFKDNFGDNARVYIGFEFDWQMWRIPGIGTLGPAYSLGRVSMSRDSRTITGRPGDNYTLLIYPMYLAAVLRVDTLWRNFGIPLMPYGKAGPALAPGRPITRSAPRARTASEAQACRSATTSRSAARSRSTSSTAAPRAAWTRRPASTPRRSISNTLMLGLNGFGDANTFRVGTNTWSAGMTFEF